MTQFNKTVARILAFVLVLFAANVALFAEGARESDQAGPMAEGLGEAKYVFVFIGDGMGLPQMAAAEAYLNTAKGGAVGIEKLSFSDFPAQGLTTTYAQDRFITGSAAAGTAISCGQKTTVNTIAMNGDRTQNLKTIAEMAKEAGMKVGIVSSVNIDHATPASFYAHSPHRGEYYNIGVQMANSNFDYFAGGAVRVDKTPKGEKSVLEMIEDRGWIVADSKYELDRLRPGKSQVFAYTNGFAGAAMNYELDRDPQNVSLADFTAKGIELLNNPDGFFMMVEGGKIDWACHANDGVSAIYDTIAFDEAVREAIKFYNRHPNETLIVVTGDHECGGLTLGFAGTGYATAFDVLSKQTVSFEAFDKHVFQPFKQENSLKDVNPDSLLPAIEEYFGLTDLSDYEMQQLEAAFVRSLQGEKEKSDNEETYITYGSYEPLTVTITHILNRRAGLAWTSYSHTGVPVPTFAMGPGAGAFHGYYDNTDIFHKTVAAMGMAGAVASR
jgi:alkaline phosphatase